MRAATTFVLPPELSAAEPPEARGVARDGVRLLIARDCDVRHAHFTDLPAALHPGDVVVVNTSATEPAALDARRDTGRPAVLHLSGPASRGLDARESRSACEHGGSWTGPGAFVVELRTPDGRRVTDAVAGEAIRLPRGVRATLLAGYPDARVTSGSRLWRAGIPVEGGVVNYVRAVGRPIGYAHLRRRWPMDAHQTIFSTPDGEPARTGFQSAEMPSAGRPFTPGVLDGLRVRGVGVAEIVLHTGVSSPEAGEVPQPERYRVPPATVDAVNAARAAGGRIVAVGTTATRALETVTDADSVLRAGSGWTDLVLGPGRPARVVNGLVTGWHEPEASHLMLLEAVAGTRMVDHAYAAALRRGYLWHEFGDSCLLLPSRPARVGTP